MNRRYTLDWITAAAAIEVVTGLTLIIRPSLFGRLLLGAELSSPGQALGRLAGIALLALSLACWRAEKKSAIRALISARPSATAREGSAPVDETFQTAMRPLFSSNRHIR